MKILFRIPNDPAFYTFDRINSQRRGKSTVNVIDGKMTITGGKEVEIPQLQGMMLYDALTAKIPGIYRGNNPLRYGMTWRKSLGMVKDITFTVLYDDGSIWWDTKEKELPEEVRKGIWNADWKI